MTNWTSIREDYEHGLSLRVLAAKYTISKSMIHKKATQEQWTVEPQKSGQSGGQWTRLSASDQPLSSEIATIAKTMVKQLGQLSKVPLTDLRDHKMFADALSQYGKILVTDIAGQQHQETQGSPIIDPSVLPYLTNEELNSIEKFVAQAEQRKLQAEQDRETLEKRRA